VRRTGGLLVTVLLLAGCGGDDGPSAQLPTSSPAPTPSAPGPEEAAADEALTAFQEAVRVTDQARQDPVTARGVTGTPGGSSRTPVSSRARHPIGTGDDQRTTNKRSTDAPVDQRRRQTVCR
jgi:hypothetical protein